MICVAELVELCDVWSRVGGIVCCVEQIWWNCSDDMCHLL